MVAKKITFSLYQIQLIKLIGAFIIVGSILMIFYAIAVMFESWTNIKLVNNCLIIAGNDTEFLKQCKELALESLDIFIREDQIALLGKQLYIALIKPIVALFFWIIAVLFGIIIYNFDKRMVKVK